jgi:hypothetical protein
VKKRLKKVKVKEISHKFVGSIVHYCKEGKNKISYD